MLFYKNNISLRTSNINVLTLNIKNFQFINYKLKQIKFGPSKVISNHLSIRGVFSKPKLLYPRIKKLKKFDYKTLKIRRGRWRWRWWFKKSRLANLSNKYNF